MLSLRAYAKVNLALSVGPPEPAGSRKPGWHAIASWFHSIELHDRIDLAPVAKGQVTRFQRAWSPEAPRAIAFDWPLEKDLIARAHALMEQRTMKQLPVAIAAVKSIPAGGGLGGGSSDAAAVMMGLNRLFSLGFTAEQLRAFSTPLGSDVAFFIDEPVVEALARAAIGGAEAAAVTTAARPAMVTGFGDRHERVGRCLGAMVLVFPEFGCATPAVYKAFDASPARLDEARVRGVMKGRLAVEVALFNDLTLAAARVEPRLAAVMERARAIAGRPVHMTGSGSTLFVVAKDETEARALAGQLRTAGLGAVATRLV